MSSLWPPVAIGGAEIYAGQLAAQLQARGHDVAAVTQGVSGDGIIASITPWPYRVDAYVHQPAWRRAVMHGRDLYDPLSASALRKAMASFRPDVVHTHSVAGLSTAVLMAPSAAGHAHVHHLHDYWLLCERTSFTSRDGQNCDQRCVGCVTFRTVRNTLLRRHGPDRVIAVSQYVARAHEHLDWVDGRIEVVPLPVDSVHAAAPRRTDASVTFGYIGQLSAHKGVRTLLRAFADLDVDGARLVVAGRGALEPEIVGEGVTAIGWVDDDAREDFWRSIDCLVVPSEWAEPAGLVAVEARGRGLPVIAANSGGLLESLDEHSHTLTFEPGDREGLTASMRRLAADRASFRPRSESSGQTWSEHVELIERVYENAIATRRG